MRALAQESVCRAADRQMPKNPLKRCQRLSPGVQVGKAENSGNSARGEGKHNYGHESAWLGASKVWVLATQLLEAGKVKQLEDTEGDISVVLWVSHQDPSATEDLKSSSV